MACETFDTQINSAQYVTTQWSATKQVLMKFKLAKTFGECLFEIVGLMSVKADDPDKQKKQMDAFKSAMHLLFKNNSPEDVTNLIKETLTCGATKREGVRLTSTNFDAVFNDAGLPELYKAFLFVIKSNYSDFFKGQKGAEDLLAELETKLSTQENSQT